MPVKAIPEGYHSVTPYLIVPGVARLIDFLKQAFHATEVERIARPDGAVMHADVKIGDSHVMMGEPGGPWQPIPAGIYIYLEDADAAYRRALEAGATSINEPTDQFYGDRVAAVKDPSGNTWWIGTHKEDVSREELDRRIRAMAGRAG